MDYNLLEITSENRERELQVIQEIYRCIQNEQSWYFDAGAGAGKTYALIQSLQRIILEKGHKFDMHNQKVMCITYTNVAANEIRERLGKTSLVDVSTIHDCIWKIISPHQDLLVLIHREKLLDEIRNMEAALKNETWAEKYRQLDEEDKNLFLEIISRRRDDYYKYKNSSANDFRNAFIDIDARFGQLMSNVGNFKKVVDKLFVIEKYKLAVSQIEMKNGKYKKVVYDSRFNNDRLERMLISHDTLLVYMERMVARNDLLKQIICDKYPFVLVDEYQDTNPLVVKTLNMVTLYAKKIGHTFVIGYYGDIKQNIYDNGIGGDFKEYNDSLYRIEKIFNRRCSPAIVNIANQIRNDGLEQETIYKAFPKGEVSFYNFAVERKEIIDFYIDKWQIDSKNQLHCFELTNEYVAEQSGFSDIYNFFKMSRWYKLGTRYELLRDHVLSMDETKLGIVPKLLFRILDFRHKVSDDKTMLLDIFADSNIRGMNISELRECIEILRNVDGNTLEQYLINLFSCSRGKEKLKKCIDYVVAENIESLNEMRNYILNQLFYFMEGDEVSEEERVANEQSVMKFLQGDMTIFERWYEFITDSYRGNVVYHTYHSTKGREFDNVIIFMNSKFGRNSSFFGDLLKNLSKDDEGTECGTAIEKARNLLYVAVTRATKNLCIVYFDNIDEARDDVTTVFGEIKNTLELKVDSEIL